MRLSQEKKDELLTLCRTMRKDILRMIYEARSGHPGGSLSCVEIMAMLYFFEMRIDPKQPDDPERDRFILSKGHAAPTVYSALAHLGYVSTEVLPTLRKFGSPLQGHPCKAKLNGLECSAGSLGQGLSVANGLALAAKKTGRGYRTYCLLGDGELQEGQVWEAAMSAAHFGLDNVCAIVDFNGVQLDGTTKEIMNVEPVGEKFAAFNWNVIEADGHDLDSLAAALDKAREEKGRPSVIVARCVKGKGVSFMEHKAAWHGAAPNAEQLAAALDEIG